MGFADSLKHAWNAFRGQEQTDRIERYDRGPSSDFRQQRPRSNIASDKTIITGIYNRIAIDAAAIDMYHVRLDENKRFLEEMPSGLNNCLNLEANLDQGARDFKQDIYWSMLTEGVIAIVPIDTSEDINITEAFDVQTLRVGTIVQFFPEHVQVNVWNQARALRELVIVPKRTTAIVKNPFYDVMNEPNSIVQRLIRKLALLDAIDEQSGSGKLDIIIQLPYVVKSEARRDQAKLRKKELEDQLVNSQHGIAYTDNSEKITQLNRPAENNMMKQIEYLTNMLYGQLGLSEKVFNGLASEAEMVNYYNRTTEPIVSAVRDAMRRAFLTKTARSQKQSIEFFRDPFRLLPISEAAELFDKLGRNAIMTSNESRSVLGLRPSREAIADELVNKNMPAPEEPEKKPIEGTTPSLGELTPVTDRTLSKKGELQNGRS